MMEARVISAGAPEVMRGERYTESVDTFSFSLVLLCLAVGDIGYVRKHARRNMSTAYALGYRPPIPALLDFSCPDLASLIGEMWLDDFRARPPLNAVVPRLEAASSADLKDFDPACDFDPAVGEAEDGHGDEKSLVAAINTIATLKAEIAAQAAAMRASQETVAKLLIKIKTLETKIGET